MLERLALNGRRSAEAPINLDGLFQQIVRDSARVIASAAAPLLDSPGDHVEFAFNDLDGRRVRIVVEQG